MQSTFVVEKSVRRVMLRDMPAGERPAARLTHYGPAALSTAELIACVINAPDAGDLATELIVTFKGVTNLARATSQELSEIPGMGPANCVKLKAAFELGRRHLMQHPNDKAQITSPADAANLLMLELGHKEQEHLVTLILDTKNYVLKYHTAYIGNVNSTVLRIAEVFREPIRTNATAIIMAHNHPSGDPTPSPEDVRVTRQIVGAGHTLDIEVLDHLIIGQATYVSMKERGLGFD